MARRAASATALACLVAGLASCGEPDAAPRLQIVARLAAPPGGIDAPEGIAPIALKLATQTRHAIPGEAPLELRVERAGSRLRFSTAAGAGGGAPGHTRFEIRLVTDANASAGAQIFDARLPNDGLWSDHDLALPPATPPFTLRLLARASQPAVSPVWGSLRIAAPEPAGLAERPNVLLIDLDTLGAAYLSSSGAPPGVSPELDAFLAGGFSFRRAYAQYGNTLVSHASLFSGLYPIRHGVYPGRPARALDESLVALLAGAGFETVALTEGAFVSASFGFSVGFDSYDDGVQGISQQMAGGAARTFGRASRWLEEHGASERFFLFVHTYEVHQPYLPRDAASRELAARLTPGDDRIFSREFQADGTLHHNSGGRRFTARQLERLRALHLAEIHGVDAEVGGLLARLSGLGLERDTLVVVLADHGDQFGEHGKVGHSESLHNRVLNVPLGFRLPGVVVPGASDRPVQLVDVVPTILELSGVPRPPDLDGHSLADSLRGGEAESRPAFSEQRSSRGECLRLGLDPRCELGRIAVQSERFKLIGSRVPVYERLYDLAEDPLERHDVAERHPEVVERLRVWIDDYRSREAAPSERADPGTLDPDTLRRLEELGYLDVLPEGETRPAAEPF